MVRTNLYVLKVIGLYVTKDMMFIISPMMNEHIMLPIEKNLQVFFTDQSIFILLIFNALNF